MSRTIITSLAAIAMIAGATITAQAGSLNDAVSDSALSDYCSEHGVGETNASLTLAGGTTVTGTIGCTAANVASGVSATEVAEAAEEADEQIEEAADDAVDEASDAEEDQVDQDESHDDQDSGGDSDDGDEDESGNDASEDD